MFTFTLTVEVPDDHVETFLALTQKVAEATRQEKGCLIFDLLRSASRPNEFTTYEAFTDEAGWNRHVAFEHTKAWMRGVQELVTERGFDSDLVSAYYDHWAAFTIAKGQYQG